VPLASALQKALEDAKIQSLSSNRQVWIWKTPDKYVSTLGEKPEGGSLMGRVIGEEGVNPQLYAGGAGVVGGSGLVSPSPQSPAQAQSPPPLTLDDVQKRISELQSQQRQSAPDTPVQEAPTPQGPAPLTIDSVQARIAELESQNKPSVGTLAKDIAVQTAHGLGRGVAGIPGIPGTAQQLTSWLSSLLPGKIGEGLGASPLGAINLPTAPETTALAEKYLISDRPAPQTKTGRFAGDVAEYLPAAAIGGPTGLAGRLGFGLATGLASEGSKAAGAPPLVQMLAGLSPGIAAGGVKMAIHQFGPAASIRTAAEGISPEDWQRGAALAQAGQEVGVPLMGHEAVSPAVGQGGLGMLATKMSGTYAGGPPIRNVIEQRPAQIAQAAEKQIGKLGPETSPQEVLSSTKETMNKAIRDAENVLGPDSEEVARLFGTNDNPNIVRKIASASSPGQLRDLMINPDNVSPDTVRAVSDIFKMQGKPDNLSAWLRDYLDNSFSKASTDIRTGKNPSSGVEWRNAIYGNKKQRDVLDAYYSEIDPTGKAGEGFQKLMQVLEKTGKTQLSATQSQRKSFGQMVTAEELPNLSGLGASSAALYTGHSPIAAAGWYVVGNALQNFITKVLPKLPSGTIARNLTAPDSVERLRALAGKEPLSSGAAASVLSILGTR